MASVTSRMASYDLMDWWLSDPKVDELLVEPRQHKVQRWGESFVYPFFPVAQQPEGGFPYVRYTVQRTTNFPQWWIHHEQLGMELYMEDIDHSTQVLNTFIDMAGRGDQSARDLENWLIEEERTTSFVYHSIEWQGGGDIGASDEEGGAHSRVMMFNIQYSPLQGRNIRS